MYTNTSSRGASRGRDFSRAGGSNRRFSSFSSGRSRGGFGGRGRAIKKLDARLFVSKASVGPSTEANQVIKNSFQDFAITDALKRAIVAKNYIIPTPIQDQAIPVLLEGRDVIGIANTGTGKTAAYLIPLINKVLLNRDEKILIVAPTRELAVQINTEIREFTPGMGIRSVLTIGGASMYMQRNQLRQNFNFVIGTPGRLLDLLENRAFSLSQFRSIVLDEVDRMVDIGFINDVKYLVSLLPAERQSLFFSATIDAKVNTILEAFVKNPVRISVKTQNTAKNVDQDIIRVRDRSQKIEQLHAVLSQEGVDKVIVFVRTKREVERLDETLSNRGYRTAALHGNKSQGQRQRALEAFRNDRVNILLATDVASRGIDVQNVSHVINYDAPESYEDYVHRIGRTGRANKTGVAITFVE